MIQPVKARKMGGGGSEIRGTLFGSLVSGNLIIWGPYWVGVLHFPTHPGHTSGVRMPRCRLELDFSSALPVNIPGPRVAAASEGCWTHAPVAEKP